MLRLKSFSEGPPQPVNPAGQKPPSPRIWNVWVHETQTWLSAGSFIELGQFFEKNLSANGHPVPTLVQDDLQQRICAQTPPDWHGCGLSEENRVVSKSDVLRWAKTVHAQTKEEPVPQEEAERRADICRQCRFRVDVSSCFGCAGILGFLNQLLMGRSVSNPEQLKFCGACGCENRSQIFYALNALKAASPGVVYPDDVRQDSSRQPLPCWKR